MTALQRDTIPRPPLFERLLRAVAEVADERRGGRVYGAFAECLDGAVQSPLRQQQRIPDGMARRRREGPAPGSGLPVRLRHATASDST